MRRIEFHPSAEREFVDAAKWYDRARPGLGEEFVQEIQWRVTRLLDAPWDGFPSRRGTRTVLAGRFPYSIVFLDRDPVIHIVAVAHTSREPDYWSRRLDETSS